MPSLLPRVLTRDQPAQMLSELGWLLFSLAEFGPLDVLTNMVAPTFVGLDKTAVCDSCQNSCFTS